MRRGCEERWARNEARNSAPAAAKPHRVNGHSIDDRAAGQPDIRNDPHDGGLSNHRACAVRERATDLKLQIRSAMGQGLVRCLQPLRLTLHCPSVATGLREYRSSIESQLTIDHTWSTSARPVALEHDSFWLNPLYPSKRSHEVDRYLLYN